MYFIFKYIIKMLLKSRIYFFLTFLIYILFIFINTVMTIVLLLYLKFFSEFLFIWIINKYSISVFSEARTIFWWIFLIYVCLVNTV